MTSGLITIGEGAGPYQNGATRQWSGADDLPNKSAWNPYVLQVENNWTRNDGFPQFRPGFARYPGFSWSDNDNLKFQKKLVQKVKEHEFNAGVFAGTAHEVSRLVVGTVSTLYQGIKAVKQGRLRDALRLLPRSVSGTDLRAARRYLNRNDVANTWLAIQFGWKPLYQDVHAAAVAFEVLSKPPRTSQVVVSMSRSGVYDGSQAPTLYHGLGTYKQSRRLVFLMTERLSFARTLGLADPRSVLWELQPFSFVADWFIPIGTYLENLAVIPHLQGTFRETQMLKSECSFSPVPCVPDYQTWCFFTSCYGGHHSVRFERLGEYFSLNVPAPRFKGLASLWSSRTRVANAVALLSQVVKPKVTWYDAK